MFDKSSLVASNARQSVQPVFKRCQGSDGAAELYPGCPEQGRYVEQERLLPPESRQSSQRDKENEDEVYGQYQVGRDLIEHLCIGLCITATFSPEA